MGAFCVFGVSRGLCRATATKKVSGWDSVEKRALSMGEWKARRDAMAERLFTDSTRLIKVSPEFDAPQFCADWLAISPDEVKLAKVMVRGPKVDKGGAAVKRNGAQLMTWVEFNGIPSSHSTPSLYSKAA